MKVLFVNQSFWPDVAPTAQHAHDLARALAREGDEVTVITSRSIYGEAGGTLPRQETVDGIRIRRVTSALFGKAGLFARAVDFVVFGIAAAFRALLLPRQDVVVCLTTPPFIGLVGVLLKALRGTRYVLWSMDLYPDVPVTAGVLREGSLAHRAFDAIERFCLRRADLVVVLGRCMQERVLAKGIDPARVRCINVWSDPAELGTRPASQSPFRAEWGLGERFVVQYSGNFGIGHDLDAVADAAVRLAGDRGIGWAVVGGGVLKRELESIVAARGVGNVVFRPYQPRSRLGELIALGDVHIVSVAPGFEGLLVPSKFYGVLAAGRPTIFIGSHGSEIARVIDEEGCGIVVPNGDGAALAAAIVRLRDDPALAREMGERGRRAAERKYGTDSACARWRAALVEVARRDR
jgi:glycosyltransferase involved in cell wall biosynthesis